MISVLDENNKHSLYDFFTGFIKVDPDKRPYTKNWQLEENQKQLHELTDASGIGGVINSKSYIVDVDDPAVADLVLDIIRKEKVNCRVHKTTKGIHIFFKKGGVLDVKSKGKKQGRSTQLTPICGLAPLKVDYFTGGQIVLKLNGEPRELLYEADKIDTCPAWLQPWSNKKEDCEKLYTNFANLKEGDGRNTALFEFGGKCKQRGLTYAEFVDTARIINTYIFSETLDVEEFETVTRKEAWDDFTIKSGRGRPKTKAENLIPKIEGKIPFPKEEETKKPSYDVVARALIEKFHIKRIDSKIHVYEDGVYRLPNMERGGNILEHDLEVSYIGMSNRIVSEVMGSIERQCLGSSKQADKKYLNFKNAIYNLETNEILPHSPDIITINQIPHNINFEVKSELLEKFLVDISDGDEEIRRVLEEIAGASLYRGTLFDTMPILTGSGCNGKSTYLAMLQNVVGLGNWSAVDIKYFDTDVNKFRVKELQGKTVNFSDDASDLYIKDSSNLKKIISGNTISAEGKGKDAFNFNPYATVVISVNEMPRIKDSAGATTRRFLMIPFEAVFDKPDYDMPRKLAQEEVAEALIVLGIKALQRMLKANTYTISQKSIQALKEFQIENDSVRAYLEELKYDNGEYHIWEKKTGEIYFQYEAFCNDRHLAIVTQAKMTRRIKEITKGNTKKQRFGERTHWIFVQK